MIYERKAWTPWTVEVLEEKHAPTRLYEDVFRTAHRVHPGKEELEECEQFTLLWKDSDDCLCQIRMFKDGAVSTEAWVPLLMAADPEKKKVTLQFLAPLARYRPRE